ncbi:unnamed protein product [Cylicostephanus goldi]|uniref:Arf-GAP domain-containing protein n=1 Tax=Cylicostephanus goldi TaxID=71465 RepID=A0A3P6RD97_CYLGO|nr:unnamed protein product [Cylicostephanus goldi]
MVNAPHASSGSTLSAQKKRQDEKNLRALRRGLNPPHRVKSISMANFTNEEIERVRSLGNEENSHTWLGLYSGNPPKMTNKDEITAFLIKKYEKKEWFVSRSELEEQERLLNQAKEVASQSGTSMKSGGSASSKEFVTVIKKFCAAFVIPEEYSKLVDQPALENIERDL